MPTYQYVCTECTRPHEAQQSFSDPALTDCPRCDGALRKVFSAVGVVFKGSGFYRNDSRAPQKDSEPAGDTGSKDTGTKDSGTKDSGTKNTGASKKSSRSDSGSPTATSSAGADRGSAA
ncbi:MAG: FmdB family transcriptional regulator [Actinomycetota bacterium]|nr:FmdB family transcriptional regulator [Actinomycetota bacterium]